MRKRRDKIPAGKIERGERKQIVDEVSKADQTMSKPGGDPSSGISLGDGPSGIRHGGGAKLNQAFVRNVRTCAPMQREKSQAAKTARIRVPMRRTGTEQHVLGMKAL